MKAQAALEFLMTYGWAILIVVAVIAALYAMGVFRLPTTGISKPVFPPGTPLTYVDHNLDSLVLTSVRDVRIDAIYSATKNCTDETYIFANGRNTTNCTGAFKGDVTIVYTDLDSGLTHQLTVRFP
ncbi:MAG: hypothetical protein QXI09_01095 [Candidatus Aenigmatarchaeota archaeon]